MALLVAGLIVTGCKDSSDGKVTDTGMKCPVAGKGATAGDACCPVPGKEKAAAAGQAMIEGTVLQTLSAGRYVYVEVDTKSGPVWVAAVTEPVAKGDKISCRQGTVMEKFESPILKRTFDKVHFVDSLKAPQTEAGAMPTNHPAVIAAHGKAATEAATQVPEEMDIIPAAGGITIAGLVKLRDKLKGADILLRGKVTKYNAAIMGSNWLHVRDSSAKRDLVVTTKTEVKVGDTVLIKGKLECDIDLGSGYSYDIIVRNADVTVEK